MKTIQDYEKFKTNEKVDYYKDPVQVGGVKVSLTELRKKIKVTIGGESAELTKDQGESLLATLEDEMRKM